MLRFTRYDGAKTESQGFVFLDSFLKERSGPTTAFLNTITLRTCEISDQEQLFEG